MDMLILLLVFLLIGIVALVMLGNAWPGSGADLVDMNPGRREAAMASAEEDDMRGLVALENRRRREAGLPLTTEARLRDDLDAW